MIQKLLSEPIAIATAIKAVIFCAVQFGLDWTPEQVVSVMVAVEAVLALVTRALVTPNAKL